MTLAEFFFLFHLIPQSLLFVLLLTNLGNIFGLDTSKLAVEWGFSTQNINRNAGSYVNILWVLLYSIPRLLLFV